MRRVARTIPFPPPKSAPRWRRRRSNSNSPAGRFTSISQRPNRFPLKWGTTIASGAQALLLASCGRAEITGKWENSLHVAWVFAENGDCYSLPKGRSGTWCRWKGLTEGDYDIELGDDVASNHVVGHIRGG